MKGSVLPLPKIDSSPPARKVSRQHLDTLYNTIVMILGILGFEYCNELIAVISSIHNNFLIILDRDPIYTIQLYKSVRRWFIEYYRGYRLDSAGFKEAEWSLEHNCPRILSEAISLFDRIEADAKLSATSKLRLVQCMVAMLEGHRVIITPMKVNTATITEPCSVKSIPSLENLSTALKALGITPESFQEVYRSKCSTHRFHVITSAGPNGQATWTAHEDAMAVLREAEVGLNFLQFAQKSNLTFITKSLLSCVQAPKELSNPAGLDPICGKLHAIEEWGGKTRIVAILDYWTQHLFWPLHDTINHFLAKIPMDGTFDQLAIAEKVKLWTRSTDKPVFSFDLTAATDRIPIALQQEVLAYLLGDEVMAENWAFVLNKRRYYTDKSNWVKYAVGQPMGAKSSFAMLALVHHVIMMAAAISANKTEYKDYVILGDDNTHTDLQVSGKYIEIMASYGVEINMSKSLVHQPGSVKPAAEICKRVFVEGNELTALTPKLAVKVNKFGHMAPDLQNKIHERGYIVPEERILEFFAGLVDKRSLKGVLVLNSAPSSVSGLRKPIDPNVPLLEPKNWFPGLKLTHKDLTEAFTFALVTEQLKRVDALLKGTAIMTDLLATKSNGDFKQMWLSALGNIPDAERVKWLASMPDLTPSHPVVQAAVSEMERVLDALSGLRSGNAEMVAQARRGLLDILRNSLSEIWEGESERAGAARRSVFNRMLSVLERIAKDPTKPEITFSLLLTSVQRMWSVYWKVGEEVRINMVKSKVQVSSVSNKAKLSEVSFNIDLKNFRI